MNPMKIETRVGLFVLIGLFILFVGIIWKSNLVMRTQGFLVIGSFKTVSGLLGGGEVRYRGYVVGSVFQVTPGPRNILVYMYIHDGIKIPKGSKVRIDFDGLIGEKFVNVIPKMNEKENIPPGTVLEGYAASGLVDFIDAGTANLMETKEILTVLRKILTSDKSQNSLQGLIVNINRISEKMDSVMTKVDMIFTQKSAKNMGQNLDSIFVNLNQTVKRLNHLIEGLDMNVQGQDVKDIVKNLKVTTERLSALSEAIGKDKDKLLKDMDPILKDTREAMGNAKTLVAGLNRSTAFLTSTNVGVGASLYNNNSYDVGGKVQVGSDEVDLNIGSQAGTGIRAKDLTYGRKIVDDVKASAGLVNYQPGVKIEHPVTDRVSIEHQVYNPSALTYLLKMNIRLIPNLKALFGYETSGLGNTWTWGMGFTSGQ